MTKFYEDAEAGRATAAALRAAQVEMWKQKQWQSPYFWPRLRCRASGDEFEKKNRTCQLFIQQTCLVVAFLLCLQPAADAHGFLVICFNLERRQLSNTRRLILPSLSQANPSNATP